MQATRELSVLNVKATEAGLAELARLMPGVDIARMVAGDPSMLMSVQKARRRARVGT